jgi:predicted amidohydrolase
VLIKVVSVQARMGRRLTLPDMIHIFKQRPDFVCLPEYWLLDGTITDLHRAALRQREYLQYLCRLSEELSTCLVGGTVVTPEGDGLYNASPVIRQGDVIGCYRKRHPVPGEMSKGVRAGDANLVLTVDGVRMGVMVCGDVFHPEMFRQMRSEYVDVIFVPTTSPYRPDDSIAAKQERDRRLFVDGARTAGAYLIKTCGVGALFGKPLQGRSLVAAPWGILDRIRVEHETNERVITATLDIDEVREFRRRFAEPAS